MMQINELQPSSLGDEIWYRTWGTGLAEWGTGVWYNDSSSIYTTGYTFNGGIDYDIQLIKWDSEGNQIWNRTWRTAGIDRATSIWGDEQYVFVYGSTGISQSDILLIKWDSDGNQLWNQTWGGSLKELGTSIWGNETVIYTTGSISNGSANSGNLTFLKWNATSGAIIWNKNWSTPYVNSGMGIWANDSIVYTCGYLDLTPLTGHPVLLLIKWYVNGTEIWSKNWSKSGGTIGDSVWCDNSNVYTYGEVSGNHPVLIKWNANDGQDIWNITEETFETSRGVSICGDENYIFACGQQGTSAVIFKYDKLGNQVWNRTWDIGAFNSASTISLSGSYIYACGLTSLGAGSTDLILSKWDKLGYHPNATFQTNTTIILVNQSIGLDLVGSPGDPPTAYQWSFGDGTPNATATRPNHIYAAEGTYHPVLTISDVEHENATHSLATPVMVLSAGGDNDSDGIPNAWELDNLLDPLNASDADLDLDGDGISNLDEFGNGTLPYLRDSDGDGCSDLDEIHVGTDPMNPGDHPVLGLKPAVAATMGVVSVAGASTGILAIVHAKKKRSRTP